METSLRTALLLNSQLLSLNVCQRFVESSKKFGVLDALPFRSNSEGQCTKSMWANIGDSTQINCGNYFIFMQQKTRYLQKLHLDPVLAGEDVAQSGAREAELQSGGGKKRSTED